MPAGKGPREGALASAVGDEGHEAVDDGDEDLRVL